jgi:hypothetical protein
MFSLLEIFRITVSQLLFPQNLRGFSSEMTTKNPFRTLAVGGLLTSAWIVSGRMASAALALR